MEFLGLSGSVVLAVKMIAGFVAGVAGVALWAHTRESAWVLVITATLLGYVEVLMQFLDLLGVFSLDTWMPGGISLLRVLFAGGIPLLYAIGLFLGLRSFLKP